MKHKKIAVVGAKGVVGSALMDFLSGLGHTVFAVDRDTELTLDVVKLADVVFIATLPIEEVASLIKETAAMMHPRTLLIHGTSIEQPSAPNQIDVDNVIERGITLSHLHFHFRPEIPLNRTLFGQNVSVSFQGDEQAKWSRWLETLIVPHGAIMSTLAPCEHDEITIVSQLIHMVIALVVGSVWSVLSQRKVTKGIEIGGPPSRLLTRSVIRSSSGVRVLASILTNHPFANRVLRIMRDSITEVSEAITNHDPIALEATLTDMRQVFEPAVLARIEQETAQMSRLEADMRQAHFTFRFIACDNQIGLLARVLREFDRRGVDKTTTIAQVDKDGGCTIVIGVRDLDTNAEQAAEIIRNWTSCRPE